MGKGVINPLAAICATQMMLETLGQEKASQAIEQAAMHVTANKLKNLAARKMGYSTSHAATSLQEESRHELSS